MPRFDPMTLQKLPPVENIRLPERLRDLRTYHGITQQEIADLLKMDRSAYSNYETGKTQPSLSSLMLFAQLYGVTADYLLGIQQKESSLNPFEKELLLLVKRYFSDYL